MAASCCVLVGLHDSLTADATSTRPARELVSKVPSKGRGFMVLVPARCRSGGAGTLRVGRVPRESEEREMSNATTVTGNLTQNPEIRYTKDGQATTLLGLAVNRAGRIAPRTAGKRRRPSSTWCVGASSPRTWLSA